MNLATQPKSNLVNLRGQLERVTYENEENDYVVAKVRVYDRLDHHTGNIPSPTPGEILSISGEWCTHPKFGDQFKVIFCKCSVPASIAGIKKYLGSALIKGIGSVMAKRMSEAIGMGNQKLFEVIQIFIFYTRKSP